LLAVSVVFSFIAFSSGNPLYSIFQTRRTIGDYSSQTRGAIISLFNDANEDARLLSLPLLASAILGAKDLYKEIFDKAKKAIDNLPITSEEERNIKYWLLGRCLLATCFIDDISHIGSIETELLKGLKKVASHDAFSTWAIGYASIANSETYFKMRTTLHTCMENLEKTYKSTEGGDRHELNSNIIWGYLLFGQAAAFAGDLSTFNFCMDHLKSL